MNQIKNYMLLTMIFLASVSRAETDVNRKAIETFNDCTASLQNLFTELESLPNGALKEKDTLQTYSARMKALLMEMHEATAGLPVSETTKVCLDYVLHKGCNLCSCNEECCKKKSDKLHQITQEDAEALVLHAEESMNNCPLPVRLAIVHDLRQAGVSDQGTLEQILMIPRGETYQDLKAVDWEKEAAAQAPSVKE